MSEQNAADERIYTLRRPFIFEEQEYSTLNLDFDSLCGDDLILADRALKAESKGMGVEYVKETSKTYQAYVVALAAKVPVELIKKLPAKDFSAVTLLAQNFLLF